MNNFKKENPWKIVFGNILFFIVTILLSIWIFKIGRDIGRKEVFYAFSARLCEDRYSSKIGFDKCFSEAIEIIEND